MPALANKPAEPPDRVLSTLNADGSRRWLRPRPSPGRFLTRRRIVAYALILVFTAIPYIRVNGKPLILLHLASRQFTFFGKTFYPTDTLLLALLLVGAFLAIFLLTAFFGRVWCGWACPQTVYLEFVFRPIERFFEGTPGRANRGFLAGSGLGRLLKHATCGVVSIYLAHTFLAYFVGVEELATWVTRSPLRHPAPFLVMVVVTALMAFDFGYFREQMCIVACPYGRFQSALVDRQSLTITYDARRGEPRGKVARTNLALPQAQRGDCVDCGLCVVTCPTGIDIRNGPQMECVGCAQCIDACDAVMAKLRRPRGLIRYSSQAAVSGEARRLIRPRVVVYPIVLGVIAAAFAVVLSSKDAADVLVLRGDGRPFTELASGEISNPVRVKVRNRGAATSTYTLRALGVEGARVVSEAERITLEPEQAVTVLAAILAPLPAFTHGALSVTLRVSDGGEFSKDVPFRMMGPVRQGPGGSP